MPKTTFDDIEKFVGFKLPEDYKYFLSTFSGHEKFVGPEYVRLWDIDEIIKTNKDYELVEYLTDTLGIGGNGGGDFIGIEITSSDNYRIILSPFLYEKQAHIEIGKTFTDFLSRLDNGQGWFK